MGQKINIKELLTYVDDYKNRFEICHGCGGIELSGSMKVSSYPDANIKKGDMICAECASNREYNRKQKERKQLNRQKKEESNALILAEIKKIEDEFQILATALLDWKIDVKHLDKAILSLSDFFLDVSGDGAFEILISKIPMTKDIIKTYRDLVNDAESLSLSLPTNVARIYDDEIGFHRFAFELINKEA